MINQPSLGEQDQTIMTTAKALSIMTSLIDEHDLGVEAEVTALDGVDALQVTLVAPNNSTIRGFIPISKTTTKRDLEVRLHDMMWNFSADAEFDELYSPDFMSHNGFTPSGFLAMLMEDQEYFEGKAEEFQTSIAEN